MKINVPFYKQTTSLNCAPTNLRMVVAYFDKDFGVEFFEEKLGIKSGKGISTIKIATAAASKGYKSDFFSKHLFFNEKNLKFDFYKRHPDEGITESKRLVEDAKNNGVNLEERVLSLEELLGYVTENSIPIVLIDWNRITGKEGYHGHFVPLVGYDSYNVYVHNCGLNNSKKFMRIKKEVFDKARKSEGTDEDIVIIHNQKP